MKRGSISLPFLFHQKKSGGALFTLREQEFNTTITILI